MISLKELQYVGSFPKYAPFPGEKYAQETLENAKECLDDFDNLHKGKNYNIIFSDANEINFQIYHFNIAHLLGIDYKELIGGDYDDFLKNILGIDRTTQTLNAYNLTVALLNNYRDVLKYDESISRDYENRNNRIINYYKMRIKCSIFDKLKKLDDFSFIKLEDDEQDKIFLTPSGESNCPYFGIRITRNSTNYEQNVYVPSSLLALQEKDLVGFLQHKASIPTQIMIDDNRLLNKAEATPREKINLLNVYKAAIKEYHCDDMMDTSGDYIATLTELDKKARVR